MRQLVPYWARPQSGFTSLFEAFVLTLAGEMPVSQIAEIVGEHDTRIWRMLHFHISKAYAAKDFSKLTHIGIDETSLPMSVFKNGSRGPSGHDLIRLSGLPKCSNPIMTVSFNTSNPVLQPDFPRVLTAAFKRSNAGQRAFAILITSSR